jgi:hypothetical protein
MSNVVVGCCPIVSQIVSEGELERVPAEDLSSVAALSRHITLHTEGDVVRSKIWARFYKSCDLVVEVLIPPYKAPDLYHTVEWDHLEVWLVS